MWLLIFIFLFSAFVYYWLHLRPANFPPGPPCIPLLGSIPFIKLERIHFYMEEARALYGPVVGLKLVTRNAVFFCSPKEVLEAFKIDAYQGRFSTMAIASNRAKKGIILTDGQFWSTQRRFTIRHLRDFGFGKASTEVVMLEEIQDFFVNTLYKKKQIMMDNVFNTSAINVLWRMMAGKRYDHNDKEFAVLLNALHETFRRGGFTKPLAFLRRFFLASIGRPEKIDCEEVLVDFIQKSINQHKETRSEEARDFIDVYLNEIEKGENEDFTELSLISVCLDLFSAGAESVGNTLAFCVLYWVLYPDLQRQVWEQVNTELRGELPTLSDRSRLPQVEAFLSEVARMNTIAPIPVPRRSMADTTYAGYEIPKDTLIVLSIWSLLRDKNHWVDPDVFRPGRFIDEDGQYRRDEWLINFGLGKRQCPGESLSKNMLFLFVVRLVQEFEFSLPAGANTPDTLGLPGFTSAPKPFEVVVTRRQHAT